MGKIFKWLFYFATIGTVALIIFAYIGPFLGFDFTPEEKTINIRVEFHED
tara:strand:- start:582 stop:731 length:150 start_codon:yes stop_codon:yes gene_type:complete